MLSLYTFLELKMVKSDGWIYLFLLVCVENRMPRNVLLYDFKQYWHNLRVNWFINLIDDIVSESRLSSSNEQSQLSFLNNWLNSHIQDAQYILRKPILIAEFGKSWKDPGYSMYQRDEMFNTVYYKVYSSARSGGAAAGGLFWQLLSEGMNSFGDGYEIVLGQSSSTSNLIAQQSHKLYQISKIFERMRNVERWKSVRAMRRRQRRGRNRGKHIGNWKYDGVWLFLWKFLKVSAT